MKKPTKQAHLGPAECKWGLSDASALVKAREMKAEGFRTTHHGKIKELSKR